MIIVEEAHAQAFSEKIKENYPGVKIRRTFKKVFSGYSLEGSHNDLIALQKDPHIIHASPVASYRVDLEESVPFIGGDDVRGLFDSEQHRLTGEGVKVGIIDTGIDYTHPTYPAAMRAGQTSLTVTMIQWRQKRLTAQKLSMAHMWQGLLRQTAG